MEEIKNIPFSRLKIGGGVGSPSRQEIPPERTSTYMWNKLKWHDNDKDILCGVRHFYFYFLIFIYLFYFHFYSYLIPLSRLEEIGRNQKCSICSIKNRGGGSPCRQEIPPERTSTLYVKQIEMKWQWQEDFYVVFSIFIF